MASLDSLPPDQRAVLQLVLQRGRSYDQIASMLSIDRAAVRQRALAAFDALGPSTRVPPEQRALITDYLLRQLPERVAEDVRRRLGDSPNDRAWARVVSSELGTLAGGPLPEIPAGPVAAEAAAPEQPAAAEQATAPVQPVAPEQAPPEAPIAAPAAEAPAAAAPAATEERPATTAAPSPPSSRRGGMIVLGVFAVLIVAAIVIGIISLTGGSSKKNTSTGTNASASTTPTSASTTTSTSTTTSVHPLATVVLKTPSGGKSPVGAAVVVSQGNVLGIVIRATGLTANTSHDAYAVWLYNSPTDTHLLGFVNPGVKSDGIMQAGAPLPSNVAHFHQLLVTRETQAKPHGPGEVVLKGSLNVP